MKPNIVQGSKHAASGPHIQPGRTSPVRFKMSVPVPFPPPTRPPHPLFSPASFLTECKLHDTCERTILRQCEYPCKNRFSPNTVFEIIKNVR